MHIRQLLKLYKSYTQKNNNMKSYGSKDSRIRIVSWSCERKGHNNETTEINQENKLGEKKKYTIESVEVCISPVG